MQQCLVILCAVTGDHLLMSQHATSRIEADVQVKVEESGERPSSHVAGRPFLVPFPMSRIRQQLSIGIFYVGF